MLGRSVFFVGEAIDSKDPKAIKFLVGHHPAKKYSYGWRLGPQGTSFYIKALPSDLQIMKVSLHGPDPARDLDGFYKLAQDHSGKAPVAEEPSFFAWLGWSEDRVLFPGHAMLPDVDHVIRFRFPWWLFVPGVGSASAPIPPEPRSTDHAVIASAPRRGYTTDIDVFVCKGKPYWPHEEQARIDEAILGPLTNKAGQHLTAIAIHRSLKEDPSPRRSRGPLSDRSRGRAFDRVRGVTANIDPRGFLLIEEVWMSRSRMRAILRKAPAKAS